MPAASFAPVRFSLRSSSSASADAHASRTAGETRVSNFLLWQFAYAEFWFTEVLWPDFDETVLDLALADYAVRERRFGVRPLLHRY